MLLFQADNHIGQGLEIQTEREITLSVPHRLDHYRFSEYRIKLVRETTDVI